MNLHNFSPRLLCKWTFIWWLWLCSCYHEWGVSREQNLRRISAIRCHTYKQYLSWRFFSLLKYWKFRLTCEHVMFCKGEGVLVIISAFNYSECYGNNLVIRLCIVINTDFSTDVYNNIVVLLRDSVIATLLPVFLF